jgi:Family of unknown function (DUF5999)
LAVGSTHVPLAEVPGNDRSRRYRGQFAVSEDEMCQHLPLCPDAQAPDRRAARVVADHLEQGWSLLCNGVVLFEDGGALLADGHAVAPPRIGIASTVGGALRAGMTRMMAGG